MLFTSFAFVCDTFNNSTIHILNTPASMQTIIIERITRLTSTITSPYSRISTYDLPLLDA